MTAVIDSYTYELSGGPQFARIVDVTSTDEIAYSTYTDSDGNVYFTGQYGNGIATIKDQSGTTLGTLPSASSVAAFVCKFDLSGTYQYSRIIDTSGANDYGTGVTVDGNGNMYVSGYYTVNGSNLATIKDESGNALATLPIIQSTAAFVCKFDSTGTYQYSRIIDSAGADQGLGVACDSSNNMYVCGYYYSTPSVITVNSSNVSTTVGTLPATTASDPAAFVCKFDSSGTYQYSRILLITGGGDAGSYGVACDSSNNMYMCGYYGSTSGTRSIRDQSGTSLATIPATPAASGSGFLCKFDSTGTYQYFRYVSTTDTSSTPPINASYGVACDYSNNVYFVGTYYNGAGTIRNESGTAIGTLPAANSYAGFACKFDSTGTYQYSRVVDGSAVDFCEAVSCDVNNNLYIAGRYQTSPTIKAITSSNVSTNVGTLPTISSPDRSAFVCKFDSNGTYQYSRVVNYVSGNDSLYGVTTDTAANLYICGNYITTPTISAVSSSNVVTSLGTLPTSSQLAAFLIKFDQDGNYAP